MPGERQLGVGPTTAQAQERLDREVLTGKDAWEPKLPARTCKQRRSQMRVEAGPNAPQLIRLVRTPYSMSAAWIRRQPYAEIGMPERPERVVSEPLMRLAQEERGTLERPGSKDRPRPWLPDRRNWKLRGEE